MMNSKACLLFMLLMMSSLRVHGHSWLECVDYQAELTPSRGFDKSKCKAFSRSWWNRGAQSPAPGQDTLPAQFNRPLDNNGRICFTSMNDPNNYSGKFPRATYRIGQQVRLIWPAKNHGGPADSSACRETTSDRGTEIHIKCDGQEITWPQIDGDGKKFLAIDMKKAGWQTNRWGKGWSNGKGFKNCVNYCANTDRSMCYGDFIVPDGVPTNKVCNFYWYWSSGRPYTICWEAQILPAGTSNSSRPTLPAPTPTRAPTQPPSSPAGNFVKLVKFPNPIPNSGTFQVSVDYGFTSALPREIIVDVVSRDQRSWYGTGDFNVGENTRGNAQISVRISRSLREAEQVYLKVWSVDRASYTLVSSGVGVSSSSSVARFFISSSSQQETSRFPWTLVLMGTAILLGIIAALAAMALRRLWTPPALLLTEELQASAQDSQE